MLARLFRFSCTFLFILLLQSCATTDQTGEPEQAAIVGEENFFILQQYPQAAAFYQQKLAELDEADQNLPQGQTLQLRLAAAFAHLDQIHKARDILGRIDLTDASLEINQLYLLAKAHIAIVERQARDVVTLLSTRFPPNTDHVYQAEFYGLRAQAFSMLNQRIESAQALIEKESFLDNDELILENQHAIWDILGNLSIRTLQQYITDSQDTLSGWMALIKITKAFQLSPTELKIEISKWRQIYPNHPLQASILDDLMQRSVEDVTVPQRVALLVPLSGKFKTAGEAVRDGFIAAYFSQKNDVKKQDIKIYNSAIPSNQISGLYQRAVAEGAQLVVGPIEKQHVAELARLEVLPVPTVTLNYTHDIETLPANLYQFGLSPEEEARQVSERTWLDGHIRAAILTPAGPWGDRVYKAFAERWQSIGGKVVAHQTYNSSLRDFSKPIRTLLAIDESRRRYRTVATIIKRRVKFTTRRRQDIDFIFLAAYPRQARQIRPQLKFFRASDVPVYATSHVFTGNLNQERDRDMDGIKFGDMPWVLTESTSYHGLRSDIEQLISPAGNSLQRLYALGIDAFNIIPALTTLRNYSYERYDGETGSLSLDAQRRIKRQLTWVSFRSGRPVLLQEPTQ